MTGRRRRSDGVRIGWLVVLGWYRQLGHWLRPIRRTWRLRESQRVFGLDPKEPELLD